MNAETQPIVYVTRDIERALGMTPGPAYRVVTNRTLFAESVRTQYPEWVTLIDSQTGDPLGTAGLLGHEATTKLVKSINGSILVFKNTIHIEPIATTQGWKILNPPAVLAETIENKVSQITWLGELGAKYLPAYRVETVKDMVWQKNPIVIQWAHGHTGEGTHVVHTEAELKALRDKFPDRTCRTLRYIHGPSFTVNVVVTADKILVGNVSYQITGLSPFTDNEFSTVGNDWSVTHSLLAEAEVAYIERMAVDIGSKMQKDGWRGLFGLYVIRDDAENTLYMIEINARQPASTTFESFLQNEFRSHGLSGCTTFEAHIAALRRESVAAPLIPVNDGAQILQRITKTVKSVASDVPTRSSPIPTPPTMPTCFVCKAPAASWKPTAASTTAARRSPR
jgi:hypothetical protein